MSTDPQLGVGLDAYLPLPCWDFIWLKLAQVLYKLLQPLWVHVCKLPVRSVNTDLLPWSYPISATCHLSTSSSAMTPNSWWKRCYMYIPFRSEPSTALILYMLTSWGACVNHHWEMHWYIECSKKAPGVIWILHPFSGVIVLGSTHRAYDLGRPRILALITVTRMSSTSCNEPKTQS